MPKTEYRSAIRSRKLINAALADLLQDKPLDKITVTDIVQAAGINRGTFYAHYKDVPDVIDRLIQSTFSQIRTVLSDDPKPLYHLPALLMQYIEALLAADLPFYQKVMASSAAPLMHRQLVDTVVEYLLQHEEDFAYSDHEQYVLTITFCAGGLSNLYRDWFAGKINIPLSSLTLKAQDMLLRVMKLS